MISGSKWSTPKDIKKNGVDSVQNIEDSADVWDFRRGFWWLLTQQLQIEKHRKEVSSIKLPELKILKAFRSGF